jgi:hypothetical protein
MYFFPLSFYSGKFYFFLLFFNSWKDPGFNSIPSEVIATYFFYIPSSLLFYLPCPSSHYAGETISVNLPLVIILIPTESFFYPKGSETHSVEMIVISFQAFKLFGSQFSR